jgi:hypothetical protein
MLGTSSGKATAANLQNIRVSKVIGALGDNSLGAHLITTALSSAFIRCFYHPEKPSLKTLLLEILLY